MKIRLRSLGFVNPAVSLLSAIITTLTVCDVASAENDEVVPRQKVSVTLDLRGYGVPDGSVAVSVIDCSAVAPDTATNIEAQLLLQSELKGYVENVGWYFTAADTAAADTALDALMMTQGWSRYDIPAVLHGQIAEPLKPLELSQEISGTARSLWRGKPLVGATAEIIAPKAGFGDKVITDENGEFHFSSFDLPDSTFYVVQVLNKKGEPERNIELFSQPEVELPAFIKPSFKNSTQPLLSGNSPLLSVLRMKSIQLMEVIVEATKSEYNGEHWYTEFLRVNSSKSFDSKYMEENNISSYSDIIEQIPGMSVQNGRAYYHGLMPVFAVDGVVFNPEEMRDMSGVSGSLVDRISEIEQQFPLEIVRRVDFVPPSHSGLYISSRWYGGVISIALKHGEKARNVLLPEFRLAKPLGYQRPAEFYSPKYDANSEESTEADARITLNWIPNARIEDGGCRFDFYANDNTTRDYQVTVEGLTDSGLPVRATKRIK